MVHRFRVTQWYIWDPGIVCNDCLGQLIKRVLIQAFLEDNNFLVGRTIISPIKLIVLRRIPIFAIWALGMFWHENLGKVG